MSYVAFPRAHRAFGEEGYSYYCKESTRGWRYLADGRVEVQDGPSQAYTWPKRVNDWAALIADKAHKHGIPAVWVATIMAIESGGRPDVCYRPGGAGSPCSTADGAGLMAMLQSTATSYAGRPVTLQELMDDPDLAVDLGAKMIRHLSDTHAGDFMKVALAYNAGSIRCAAGSSGSTVQSPKEPCPPTGWGVKMGCVRTKYSGPYCVPSTVSPGMNVCPNDYPGRAAAALSAAFDQGWTSDGLVGAPPGPGDPPIGPPPPIAPARASASAVAFGLGAIAGFAALRFGLPKLL